jgi:hypothetical protein
MANPILWTSTEANSIYYFTCIIDLNSGAHSWSSLGPNSTLIHIEAMPGPIISAPITVAQPPDGVASVIACVAAPEPHEPGRDEG